VLEEEQPSLRHEHPSRLTERRRRIRNRAERERDDDGVERRVGKRECLRARLLQLDGDLRLARAAARPTQHVRVGVDPDDGGRSGVVAQVQPGADADLQHTPGRAARRRGPLPCEAETVLQPHQRVIERGVKWVTGHASALSSLYRACVR
jgi:hypothetical protein